MVTDVTKPVCNLFLDKTSLYCFSKINPKIFSQHISALYWTWLGIYATYSLVRPACVAFKKLAPKSFHSTSLYCIRLGLSIYVTYSSVRPSSVILEFICALAQYNLVHLCMSLSSNMWCKQMANPVVYEPFASSKGQTTKCLYQND